MADIAGMDLKPLDPIDFDNYSDGGGKGNYTPPDEGRYIGKIGQITGQPGVNGGSFGVTKNGDRKYILGDVEIINAPEDKNRVIRFTEVSSKKYSNREGSVAIDFLRAAGIDAQPKTVAELDNYFLMASGRTFQFQLQWVAKNKDTKEETKGMESFPEDPNNPGKKAPFIVDGFDASKKWWANAKVQYFVSAVASKKS